MVLGTTLLGSGDDIALWFFYKDTTKLANTQGSPERVEPILIRPANRIGIHF